MGYQVWSVCNIITYLHMAISYLGSEWDLCYFLLVFGKLNMGRSLGVGLLQT